jgi:hypothetical protein
MDRFWKKVEKSEGCWIWTGALDKDGYGIFKIGLFADGTRRNVRAHRFAYEMEFGPIPVGLALDHLCRVRACVRPVHLEPVETRENRKRSPRKLIKRRR